MHIVENIVTNRHRLTIISVVWSRIYLTERPRRLKYGQTVARMIDAEPDFWEQILMTDEANFTLSGGVNK